MILHPFLLSLYPILFLYSHNIKELSIKQIIIPSLIALIITTTIYIVLKMSTRNKFQSGIFTSLFIIIVLFYSKCFDILASFGILAPEYRHLYLIPYVFLFWGYLIFLFRKLSTFYINATKILNLVSIVLISVNLFNVIVYEIKTNRTFKNISFPKADKTGSNITGQEKYGVKEYPDIYFLILDEYANSNTIKDIFNYDNSKFENFLTQKGFFIAQDSETSNSFTPAAIASILNMTRIETNDLNTCFKYIRENKITQYLKNREYTIINFPMRYYEEKVSPLIDSDLTYKSPKDQSIYKLSNFNIELINSSILRSFFRATKHTAKDDERMYYINSTNYIFKKIEELIDLKGPKFIYAHIECPHPPYVFNKNGEPLDKIEWNGSAYYLDQYIYITNKTKKMVEDILYKSIVPPVIVIQSDHGPNQKKRKSETWFGTKPSHTKNIFNALYLPELNRDYLYSNISPENTFRLILSHYFNEKHTLLTD